MWLRTLSTSLLSLAVHLSSSSYCFSYPFSASCHSFVLFFLIFFYLLPLTLALSFFNTSILPCIIYEVRTHFKTLEMSQREGDRQAGRQAAVLLSSTRCQCLPAGVSSLFLLKLYVLPRTLKLLSCHMFSIETQGAPPPPAGHRVLLHKHMVSLLLPVSKMITVRNVPFLTLDVTE